MDKIRIVIDNRSTGKGKNPTLTLTDTFYIFRLLRLGRLAFVALVNNNGTEKMNPFVKLNRRKSKTCRILYAPDEKLFQALIVNYEHWRQRFAIGTFQLIKPLPTVAIPVVEDNRRNTGKLLELTLPIDFERRRTNNEYRK